MLQRLLLQRVLRRTGLIRGDPSTPLLIARTLAGSWRANPSAIDLTPAEIAQVAPPLLSSGAAALGWHRLGAAALPEAEPLRQAARLLALADSGHAMALAHLAGLFRDSGIPLLIFKGWAVARLYAESRLRPYGDFDIVIRPQDRAAALALLAPHLDARTSDIAAGDLRIDPRGAARPYAVDLHTGLRPEYRIPTEALFARAIPTDGLLIPAPEDHLRMVIVHFLRSGGWRPLWLCDVAAMVEAAGPDFDWPLCLGDDPKLADWIRATIQIAHRLVDCRIDHLPADIRDHIPPLWIERAILAAWRDPDASRFRPRRLAAIREPRAWLAAHWPDPIRAAFRQGAAADTRIRPAHQLTNFAGEIARALANLTSRAAA